MWKDETNTISPNVLYSRFDSTVFVRMWEVVFGESIENLIVNRETCDKKVM